MATSRNSVWHVVKKVMAIVVMATFTSSCATMYVWNKTRPDKYVEISMKEITKEELLNKKVNFYADDAKQVYYVEKDEDRKLNDQNFKKWAMPLAMVIDTAVAVLIVCALGGCKPNNDHHQYHNCHDDPDQ